MIGEVSWEPKKIRAWDSQCIILYGLENINKGSQIINDDILLIVVLNFMECEEVQNSYLCR